jgi:DNA-directed RNA polymerase specialized sigma24 family protein
MELWNRLRQVARTVTWCDQADDVATSAWIACYEKGLKLPLPFVTLKHMCFDEMRKLKRQEFDQLPDGMEAVVPESSSEDSTEKEAAVIMESTQVTQLEGRILYRHLYEGMSFKELSAELGIDVGSVREVFNQVIAKLRLSVESEDIERAC